MSQHDQNLANAAGAAFRTDLNNALVALFTNSSGATEPSTTVAYMWWADTTTGLLKIRNAANSGWVTFGTLASTHATLTGPETFTNKTLTAAALGGTTNVSGGQLAFPATQSASADANTLDDYEEGSWSPVLTFDTAGDLSVAYTTQVGRYQKVGLWCHLTWTIQTSTFTHTTASGESKISGVPFSSGAVTGLFNPGSLNWQGITKASYTDIAPIIQASDSVIVFRASGSGQDADPVDAADMPTTGIVVYRGQLTFQTSG